MQTIWFEVAGKPRGKGRPRFTRSGHAYTPATTKAAELDILSAYQTAYHQSHQHGGEVHLHVHCIFKPPSKLRKAERQRLIDEQAPHLAKPDADNAAKLVCDALNGYLWQDDSQICNLIVEKHYGEEGKTIIEAKLI